MTAAALTAADAGILPCHACGLLSRPAAHGHELRCARCNSSLHQRKPDSIARAWALLLAACVLYIPANVLPVMHTGSLFGAQSDTIMSGVVYLWVSGSWPLAALIFFASVMVPLLKMVALGVLLVSVQRRSVRALRRGGRVDDVCGASQRSTNDLGSLAGRRSWLTPDAIRTTGRFPMRSWLPSGAEGRN